MKRAAKDVPPEFYRRNGQDERTTFTAAELLGMELPPIEWTIPDILPEGVTILAGRAKIGKSFLAFGICVAVATGGEALGRIPVGRGSVLYVALEDNKRRLQKRLRGLLGDRPAPENLHIAIEWPRLDDGGVARLDAWLREHPDARLVVIDILKSIRPRGGQGRNIYDLDYEALEPLRPLIDQHSVSILVVHHLNQGISQDPLTLISGSEGLVGVVDGTLVLRRERSKHDATLHVAGKDIVEEREHALRWDAHLTTWALMGEADDFRMSDQRRAIRDALRTLGRPSTIGEVAAHLDEPYENVQKLVRKMQDEGLIHLHHMEGASKYFCLEPPDPNSPNDPNTTSARSDSGGNDGDDPNTDPDYNANSGGDRSDWTDRVAEGARRPLEGGREGIGDSLADSSIHALLEDPPEWLANQLERCREDPRLLNPTASAIATEACGSPAKWRQVVPVLGNRLGTAWHP